MKLQRIFSIVVSLTGAAMCLFSNVYLNDANAQAVYKHIDEKGRVSYSNQPSKGAVAVDLAPLTITQGVPVPKSDKPEKLKSTSSNAPSIAAEPVTTSAPSQLSPPSQPNSSTPAPALAPVARVLPVPDSGSSQPSLPSSTFAPSASSAVAGGIGAAAMAKQRREDVKRRIVEGEIEAEEQLFSETRDALTAEQARSPAMRTLRASLPNEARQSETTIESRALIERHFSRVRDLQDLVLMHEQNLGELRAMLTSAAKNASVRPLTSATAPTKPAKSAVAPANSPKREASINPAKIAVVSTTPTPKRDPKNTPDVVAAASTAPASAANATTTAAASVANPTTPSADDPDTRAVSQLPVVKLRPASTAPSNSLVASLPKRSMAEDR